MKKLLFIVLLSLPLITFSQKKFDVSVSVSNQGQVDKTLEDFYSLNFPYGYAVQEYTNKIVGSNLKYNLGLSYVIRDSINFRLRMGFASENSSYEQSYPADYWLKSDKHKNIEICPSFGFIRNKGRFSFNTGIELPFYYILDYTQYMDSKSYDSSLQLTGDDEINTKIDGGFFIGINNYMNVKVKLSENISLFSEVNFGLMYTHLGGNYERTNRQIFPNPEEFYQSFEKKYTKFFFSPPQLQFGVNYQL